MGAVFKSLLAAGAMAAILWSLNFLNLFVLLVLALLIYFGLLYLVGGFSSRDISELIKKDEI